MLRSLSLLSFCGSSGWVSISKGSWLLFSVDVGRQDDIVTLCGKKNVWGSIILVVVVVYRWTLLQVLLGFCCFDDDLLTLKKKTNSFRRSGIRLAVPRCPTFRFVFHGGFTRTIIKCSPCVELRQ